MKKASTLIRSLDFNENEDLLAAADAAEELEFDDGFGVSGASKKARSHARPVDTDEFFSGIAPSRTESATTETAASYSKSASIRERLLRRARELEERRQAEKERRQAEQEQSRATKLPEIESDGSSDSESSSEADSDSESGDEMTTAAARKGKPKRAQAAAASASISDTDSTSASEDEEEDDVDEETRKKRREQKKVEEEEFQRVLNQDIFARQTKDKTVDFVALRLSRPLDQAIRAMNFTTATPVQTAAIPIALTGCDVLANAATGSGKTVAFLVPIIERLLQAGDRHPAIRALILSPTRELSEQIYNVALKLTRFTDIRVCCVVGGVSATKQTSELRTKPDIVVATPGRMIDHVVNTMGVGLEEIEMLVLDEADRLLEMGFVDETKELVKACPKSRQTMLFSATLTPGVEELINLSLRNPRRIMIDPESAIVDTLIQEFVRIQNDTPLLRQAIVLALCKRTFTTRTIIFTRTKKDAHNLMIVFGLCGLNAAELHGNLTQAQRTEALELFRENKVDFLICTDLAARGIDIKGVQTVINMYLPRDLPQYIHRVGRTARAGNQGCSVSLITDSERRLMKMIMKSAQNVVRKRVVPPSVITKYSNKIAELAPEIEAVLEEEKVEKQLSDAEMRATKAANLIKHHKEILARPAKEWFQSEQERQAAKMAAPLVAGKRYRSPDDEGDEYVEEESKSVSMEGVKSRADLKKKLVEQAREERKAKKKQEKLTLEELKARTAEIEAELAAAKEKAKSKEDPFRGLSRQERRKKKIKLESELALREEEAKLAEHEAKVAAGQAGTLTEKQIRQSKEIIRAIKNPQALTQALKRQAHREEKERQAEMERDGAGPDALKRILRTVKENELAARKAAKLRKLAAQAEAEEKGVPYEDDDDDAPTHVKQGVNPKQRRYADSSSAELLGHDLSNTRRFREAQNAYDRRTKIHEQLEAERRKPKGKGGFKSKKRYKRR